MTLRATLTRPNADAAFDDWYRQASQVIESAALRATDKARRLALRQIRGQMQDAGLGRLGNALGSTSDLEKGRGVHRRPNGSSASGMVFIRSGSERSRGAIDAYTAGADIRPKRGRWLWVATPEAGRLIGSGKNRRRLTPELYRQNGEPLGPLVLLKSVNGRPLLAVKTVGKSMVGARGGKVRSLTKSGRARKGDRTVQLAVLFVGIPPTARSARVNIRAIMAEITRTLPELWAQEMKRRPHNGR